MYVKQYTYNNGVHGNKLLYTLFSVNEEWKELSFRNKPSGYRISNLGNVIRPDGKPAALYYDKNGYTRFSLYIEKNNPVYHNKKAIRYAYKTHRAVAELFVENPDPEINTIVLHLNDIPDNNVYLNLKWGSYQDNMTDKILSGRERYLIGTEKPDSKYKIRTIRRICDLIYNEGVDKPSNIIKIMGYPEDISRESLRVLIKNIKSGHCWKFIRDEYKK